MTFLTNQRQVKRTIDGICFLPFLLFQSFFVSAQISAESLMNPEGVFMMEGKPYLEVSIAWTMNGETQASLNDGLTLLEEGKNQPARNSFIAATQSDPSSWFCWYYRGVANKILGKFDDAESDLKTAAKLDSRQPQIYAELGLVYIFKRKAKEAEVNFEKSLKLAPDQIFTNYYMGNFLLLMANFNKASRFYEKCKEINPQFSNAYVKQGLVKCLSKKDFKAGRSEFTKALEIDSLNREALTWHAFIQLEDKLWKESIHDLNALVRLAPNRLIFLQMRGQAYVELGDFEKAFYDFKKVVQSLPVNENNFRGQQTVQDKQIDLQYAAFYTVSKIYGMADEEANWIKKGFCYLLIGKFNEAIASFSSAERIQVSSSSAFLKATALEHMGKHNLALANYEKAIQLNNDLFDAHKKRGIYRGEMSNWAGALEDANEMLRINPKAITGFFFKGVAQYWKKDYTSAIENLSLYLATDSTFVQALSYRSECYKKIGNIPLAMQDVIRANDLGNWDFQTFANSITQSLGEGDTTFALGYIKKYVNKHPEQYRAHIPQVKIYLARKQWLAADSIVNNVLSKKEMLFFQDHSFFVMAKGIICIHQNLSDRGMKYFDEAIDLNDQNGTAYFERGKFQIQNNNKKQGMADVQRAARLGHEEAKKYLGIK